MPTLSGVKIAERLDLYATLGLNRSSRDIDVKRAYKNLALANHPNKGKGTETEFLYIAFAYHVLVQPKLRAVYDANELEFSTSRKALIDDFNSETALEIFDQFFGTSNPFAALSDGVDGLFDAEEQARQPVPAPEIDLQLVCTLEDLYNGVKKSVAVNKKRLDNEGKGQDYKKTYIIEVESHWLSGTKLRYVKEPEDVTGDVVFTVQIEKHKTFSVSGFDLKLTYPLPLYNALTGIVIPLDMPDGRRVHMSVEEIIDSSTIKTLKGEGMLNKATNVRGDVIIAFDIHFPRKLTKFQKELLDMALRLPIELTDETHIQRRLLTTGLNLPLNLAQTEREKVGAVQVVYAAICDMLCVRACMHAYMRACMHACMHAYLLACVHACMHARL